MIFLVLNFKDPGELDARTPKNAFSSTEKQELQDLSFEFGYGSSVVDYCQDRLLGVMRALILHCEQ